jgi:hypothetical protein
MLAVLDFSVPGPACDSSTVLALLPFHGTVHKDWGLSPCNRKGPFCCYSLAYFQWVNRAESQPPLVLPRERLGT